MQHIVAGVSSELTAATSPIVICSSPADYDASCSAAFARISERFWLRASRPITLSSRSRTRMACKSSPTWWVAQPATSISSGRYQHIVLVDQHRCHEPEVADRAGKGLKLARRVLARVECVILEGGDRDGLDHQIRLVQYGFVISSLRV